MAEENKTPEAAAETKPDETKPAEVETAAEGKKAADAETKSEEIKEVQVGNAINFFHQVANSQKTEEEKKEFLLAKGLNQAEIDEAKKRFGEQVAKMQNNVNMAYQFYCRMGHSTEKTEEEKVEFLKSKGLNDKEIAMGKQRWEAGKQVRVEAAVNVLKNPVWTDDQKKQFLLSKGLSEAEIKEAQEKVASESSSSASSAASSSSSSGSAPAGGGYSAPAAAAPAGDSSSSSGSGGAPAAPSVVPVTAAAAEASSDQPAG